MDDETDYSDYLSEEEAKLMAKQAKCRHDYYFVMMKCKKCGSVKSEKEEGLVKDLTAKMERYKI